MKKPSTMLIVEDQTILRESLKAFLSSQPDLQVIGEAGDGFEAIRSVQKHTPDLVLLDLSMPIVSGLDAIKEIRRVSPKRFIPMQRRSSLRIKRISIRGMRISARGWA